MSTEKAYEELVDFIAAGTKPDDIIAYRPTPSVKERVEDLIHREKAEGLSPEEKSELDHFMQLEHIMRLAKARARQYVANA